MGPASAPRPEQGLCTVYHTGSSSVPPPPERIPSGGDVSRSQRERGALAAQGKRKGVGAGLALAWPEAWEDRRSRDRKAAVLRVWATAALFRSPVTPRKLLQPPEPRFTHLRDENIHIKDEARKAFSSGFDTYETSHKG